MRSKFSVVQVQPVVGRRRDGCRVCSGVSSMPSASSAGEQRLPCSRSAALTIERLNCSEICLVSRVEGRVVERLDHPLGFAPGREDLAEMLGAQLADNAWLDAQAFERVEAALVDDVVRLVELLGDLGQRRSRALQTSSARSDRRRRKCRSPCSCW